MGRLFFINFYILVVMRNYCIIECIILMSDISLKPFCKQNHSWEYIKQNKTRAYIDPITL